MKDKHAKQAELLSRGDSPDIFSYREAIGIIVAIVVWVALTLIWNPFSS